jgi:putative transcription factor
MLSHTSHRTSLNDHNESPQEHTTNIVRMDQDWTPVVLQKTTKQKVAGMSSAHAVAAQKMAGVMTTEKKFDAAQNKSAHSGSGAGMKKLEESTEEFKHNTVSQDLSKAISQARLAKKMTQKDLATAINEKPQIIQEYESGKAIPNPQILNKLDRALGIHLPRGKK